MNERDLMLTSILKCRLVDLVANPPSLTRHQKSTFNRMQARRLSGEPLQYILRSCDFMGVELTVDSRVLIPRPETEILVEQALGRAKALGLRKELHILDLGTGSGNIAIAVAKYLPNCSVTAVDIDPRSLALAKKNAVANGVTPSLTFCKNDMAFFLSRTDKKETLYDIIISNPPYIATSQLPHLPSDVRFEPRSALDGGADGLKFYREIIARAYRLIRPGGFLLLEIGDGQRKDIEHVFARYDQYQQLNFTKDYVGTDRVVCAQVKGKSQNG